MMSLTRSRMETIPTSLPPSITGRWRMWCEPISTMQSSVVWSGRTSRGTPVRDIMTSPVIRVRPEQTTEDCMVLMGANKVRHLPVVDGGRLVGMVSIRDLVNDIIANL